METIMKSESLPRKFSKAERKKRLEAERQLPEESVASIEMALRRGLWRSHQDNVRRTLHYTSCVCVLQVATIL